MALRQKKDGGGKGRRSGLLLQSLTRCELGKSSSKTPNTSEDASSDPVRSPLVRITTAECVRTSFLCMQYEFVDSQSLQPHSPKTPRVPVQPLSRTPLGSKRLRKSPASAQRKCEPTVCFGMSEPVCTVHHYCFSSPGRVEGRATAETGGGGYGGEIAVCPLHMM